MDRVSLLADATEGATVGDGTRADDSAESVAQYERRSESGVRGDLFDGQGRGFEKLLCVANTRGGDPLGRGRAHLFAKTPAQCSGAHGRSPG